MEDLTRQCNSILIYVYYTDVHLQSTFQFKSTVLVFFVTKLL